VAAHNEAGVNERRERTDSIRPSRRGRLTFLERCGVASQASNGGESGCRMRVLFQQFHGCARSFWKIANRPQMTSSAAREVPLRRASASNSLLRRGETRQRRLRIMHYSVVANRWFDKTRGQFRSRLPVFSVTEFSLGFSRRRGLGRLSVQVQQVMLPRGMHGVTCRAETSRSVPSLA